MATMYYRPYSGQPLQDGDLPPHDALESILPEYHYIFVDPNQSKKVEDTSGPRPDPGKAPSPTNKKQKDDLDKTTMGLLDYQMRELENYRLAVRTMGQDILSLRQQIQELNATNSQLRMELAHYNDATRLLLDAQELDGLTKPEISSRYVSLKQKLGNQTMELRHYKDRVVEIQNELIKKNDMEKKYLKMTEAHTAQQEMVQKLQDRQMKVRKLEEACRKQEKVIEKMEKLLNQNFKNKDSREKTANEALMEENRRLRSELHNFKDQQRSENQTDENNEMDKLDLYHRLERAESRIISLERQLADNARKWAREKSDLQMAIKEASHGLDKPRSPLFRSYPKITNKSQVDFKKDPRRFSKAIPGAQLRKYKSHTTSPLLEPLPY